MPRIAPRDDKRRSAQYRHRPARPRGKIRRASSDGPTQHSTLESRVPGDCVQSPLPNPLAARPSPEPGSSMRLRRRLGTKRREWRGRGEETTPRPEHHRQVRIDARPLSSAESRATDQTKSILQRREGSPIAAEENTKTSIHVTR
jgi:hypothetical protein